MTMERAVVNQRVNFSFDIKICRNSITKISLVYGQIDVDLTNDMRNVDQAAEIQRAL